MNAKIVKSGTQSVRNARIRFVCTTLIQPLCAYAHYDTIFNYMITYQTTEMMVLTE